MYTAASSLGLDANKLYTKDNEPYIGLDYRRKKSLDQTSGHTHSSLYILYINNIASSSASFVRPHTKIYQIATVDDEKPCSSRTKNNSTRRRT